MCSGKSGLGESGGGLSSDEVKRRVELLVAETDPDKKRAMGLRLRSEIWDMLSESELDSLKSKGVNVSALRRGLRALK